MKNDSSHYGLTLFCTIGKQLNTDSNNFKCQKKSIISILNFGHIEMQVANLIAIDIFKIHNNQFIRDKAIIY